MARKGTHEVFGVSNEVLPDSYVDRGELDEELARLLERPHHIALRGESKCGKSWLRQRVLPDAITVQCRLGKEVTDLYTDALSQLDMRLEVQKTGANRWQGSVKTTGDLGVKILAKLGVEAAVEAERKRETVTKPIGQDVSDLRFVARILKASDRRLVIEDFHYLSVEQRKAFAFDLKALWDYGVFVVIVGVWSEQNMLLFLNPDLSGRVREVPIIWGREDLREIFRTGGKALNIEFDGAVREAAIDDCFENAGILQRLIQGTLDEARVHEAQRDTLAFTDVEALETASMAYAEELRPLYGLFAKRVSKGIRTRTDSTDIYAHAMAAVLEQPDDALIRGVSIDTIFTTAHARESRIQKGNLHTVLEKIEGLQVDDDGRGLVLAYNEADREVTVVDRQLLLYRKYSTVKWPWEDLIRELRAGAAPAEPAQVDLGL
jgi:hypothetical protein